MCAKQKWRSSGAASALVTFESPVEMTATHSKNGVGTANRPQHAGALETPADHNLAASSNDAGADE